MFQYIENNINSFIHVVPFSLGEGIEKIANPNQETNRSHPQVAETRSVAHYSPSVSVQGTEFTKYQLDNSIQTRSKQNGKQNWLTSNLEKAVEAVHDETVSAKVAAETFGIPEVVVCSNVLSKILAEIIPMQGDASENLMMALQAVQEKKMVVSQASKCFGVSAKALARRLHGNMSNQRASSRKKMHDAVKAVFQKSLTSNRAAKIYGVNSASLYRVLSIIQRHKCFESFNFVRPKKRNKTIPSKCVHGHRETSIEENEQILLYFDELYPDPNILNPKMIAAVEAVVESKMSRRLAAKSFKVSTAALATKLDKNSNFYMAGRLRKAVHEVIQDGSSYQHVAETFGLSSSILSSKVLHIRQKFRSLYQFKMNCVSNSKCASSHNHFTEISMKRAKIQPSTTAESMECCSNNTQTCEQCEPGEEILHSIKFTHKPKPRKTHTDKHSKSDDENNELLIQKSDNKESQGHVNTGVIENMNGFEVPLIEAADIFKFSSLDLVEMELEQAQANSGNDARRQKRHTSNLQEVFETDQLTGTSVAASDNSQHNMDCLSSMEKGENTDHSYFFSLINLY